MNLPQTVTSREGTVTAVCEVCWPWPPRSDLPLFAFELEDGRIQITLGQNERLLAELTDADGNLIASVESCQLWAGQPVAASIIAVWKDGNIEIRLNNELVASIQNNQ